MVVRRGPDGKLIDDSTSDDATQQTGSGTSGSLRGVKPGNPDDSTSGSRSLGADYDTPTVQSTGSLTGPASSGGRSAPADDDDRTRIVGRLGDTPAESTNRPKRSTAADDPPVGWLVVVEGPGRGEVLQLGHGRNTLGRGADARLRADFGDEEISRSVHCTITFDPKSKRFFINHGEGTNLTYIGDDPILQPTQLNGEEHIVIGATTFRFIPLCGSSFEWS